jgi:uncharacterized protein (TIRG00374 family)
VPEVSRKKSVLSGSVLLALTGLTIYLLLRGQSISQLGEILGRLRPGWLVVGLLLMLAFVGCEALCSRLILARLGHRVSYPQCLGYSFTGFYFSSITPSATGGQPAQVYYMSRDGVPPAHGALNMMLIAVCYQVVIVLSAAAAALLRPGILEKMGGGMGLLLIYGGAVNLALTAGMLCLMFLPGAARKLSGWVLNWLARLRLVRRPELAREKLERQLEEYRAGAQCMKENPGLVLCLLGVTFVQLTAQFAVPFAVYRAFGLTGYGPGEIIAAQTLVTLAVASLPLPGAVGAAEGGFVRTMAIFFGVGLVTPAVLVSRGISFYTFLLVSGGVTLLVHLRSRRRVRPVNRHREDDQPSGNAGQAAA